MIHIIHMIHMHSSGHIAELHHARKRPSIPSHQLLKKHLAKVWECSGASGICNMLQDAGA